MNWSIVRGLALLVAAAAGASACNQDLTNLTQPTGQITTETFSGTLNQNGGATYPFTVLSTGTVTITLLSVDPLVAIGFSVGTWNGSACAVAQANDFATPGSILSGTATVIGTYCARVYDVGNIADPVAFSVQIVHP